MAVERRVAAMVLALALGLFAYAFAVQPSESAPQASSKKSAKPKVVPFFSTFAWGWKRGPKVRFSAVAGIGVSIKMRCQVDLTYGEGELASGPAQDGINYVNCSVRHNPVIIPGTYTAHAYFRGIIKTPGYVWLEQNIDPSCTISKHRKLAVCTNVQSSMFYVKAGRPR